MSKTRCCLSAAPRGVAAARSIFANQSAPSGRSAKSGLLKPRTLPVPHPALTILMARSSASGENPNG